MCFTSMPPALDGLLAWAVAARDGLNAGLPASEMVPIEIPVAREPAGRFHLATIGLCEAETTGLRDFTNRRFPIPEAQDMAISKFKRIDISAGAQKSYRLPRERVHFVDDLVTFFCVGDAEQIDALLGFVDYLGKRRAVGLGRILRWEIDACDPWEGGFPVVLNGRPLRPLPRDWPALAPDVDVAFATITYPYWDRQKETELAVPSWR